MTETILKILTGGIAGTIFMTIYTYLVASKRNKQFREPILLNRLLERSQFGIGRHFNWLSGWFLHFTAGILFAAIYHYLWELTFIEPTFLSGILFGATNGLCGAVIWALAFSIHHNPPVIDYKNYYMHLIPAHVFFGIGAVSGYKLF